MNIKNRRTVLQGGASVFAVALLATTFYFAYRNKITADVIPCPNIVIPHFKDINKDPFCEVDSRTVRGDKFFFDRAPATQPGWSYLVGAKYERIIQILNCGNWQSVDISESKDFDLKSGPLQPYPVEGGFVDNVIQANKSEEEEEVFYASDYTRLLEVKRLPGGGAQIVISANNNYSKNQYHYYVPKDAELFKTEINGKNQLNRPLFVAITQKIDVLPNPEDEDIILCQYVPPTKGKK